MLDILIVLMLAVAVIFYVVGFGFQRKELHAFIGIFIMVTGLGIFSFGYTSSNSGIPGAYYEIQDENVTLNQVTLVGNPTTQLADPNFSWGVFLLATFLTFWGFDMILHSFGGSNEDEDD